MRVTRKSQAPLDSLVISASLAVRVAASVDEDVVKTAVVAGGTVIGVEVASGVAVVAAVGGPSVTTVAVVAVRIGVAVGADVSAGVGVAGGAGVGARMAAGLVVGRGVGEEPR